MTIVRILELNFGKRLDSHKQLAARIDCRGATVDIALIQEPEWRINTGLPDLDHLRLAVNVDGLLNPVRPRAAIYCSESTVENFSKISSLCNPDCAVGNFRLTEPDGNKSTITLVSMYMDGRKNIEDSLDHLEKILKHAKRYNYKMVAGMDANARHQHWGSATSNARGRLLMDFCTRNGLTIHNDKSPTFRNGNTCIDLTISWGMDDKLLNWRTDKSKDAIMTDHYPILFEIKKKKKEPIKFKSIRSTDWEKFGTIVKSRIWESQHISDTYECNEEANKLEALLTSAYRESTETKWFKCWKDESWYTKDLEEQKKDLSKKWKDLYKMEHDIFWGAHPIDREEKVAEYREIYLKALRKYNEDKRILKIAKTMSNAKKLESYEDAVKSLKSRNRGRAQLNNIKTNDGNQEPSDIADILRNEHFQNSTDEIPEQPYKRLVHDHEPWIKNLVSTSNVSKAVFKLSKYKTPGMDDIYPIMLQEGFKYIHQHLVEIFRFSLTTGYIPKKWLDIRVVFIPKPDKNYTNARDFRPISLMSFMLKTMEHVICMHLEKVIETLKSQQYAYRKNRSTIQAVNNLVSELEKKQGKQIWATFIDVEGAFDRCKHEQIYKMLRKNNVEEEIVKWIETLLKFRCIYITVLGEEIRINPLKGIPQGSVTACRLWIISIDELIGRIEEIAKVSIFVYSDDLCCLAKGKNIEETRIIMKKILDTILGWCTENNLSINRSKCEFMNFGKPTDSEIDFQGETIEFTEVVRYLGMWIDNKLRWDKHTDEIENKVKSYVARTKHVTGRNWGISARIVKRIYETVILPKVMYGVCIWFYKMKFIYFRDKIDAIGARAALQMAGLFKNTPAIVVEAALGLRPTSEELFIRATMEILNLWVRGQWNADLSFGHYEANARLDIKEITKTYDVSKPIDMKLRSKAIVPSRVKWLNGEIRMNGDIGIYSDASVDRARGRSGIGIKITGERNVEIKEQCNRVTSSTLAETYGLKRSLEWIIEERIAGKKIGICIDNVNVVMKSVARHCTSRSMQEVQMLLRTIESRGNKVKIVWIPAHMNKEDMIRIKEFRFNHIADRLASRDDADWTEWGLRKGKEQVKRELRLEAEKRLLATWQKSELVYPNIFGVKRLIENRVIQMESGTDSLRRIRTGNTETDLLNYNRTNFFLLTSFYSTNGYNRDHMAKICSEVPSVCRGCNQDKERPTHLLTECEAYKNQRRIIYGKPYLDRDNLIFNPRKLIQFLYKTGLDVLLGAWDKTLEITERVARSRGNRRR